MIKIAAPQMHNLEINGRMSFSRPSCITEQSQELLNELIDLLKKRIKAVRDDELWQFWVKVPRGSIENYGDYEVLHDLGEYKSYEEFEVSWKEWFPKDEYWYEICIASHDGFSSITVNNSLVLYIDPKQSETGYDDYTDFLQFLIDEVNKIIVELKEGNYNERVAAEFPKEYRTGIISRNVLKDLAPKIQDYTWDGLTSAEVKNFEKHSVDEQAYYYRKHPDEVRNVEEKAQFEKQYNIMKGGDLIERIPTMTANQFFNICAICYTAAQYNDIKGKTPKEMYERYADDRDGGIREIDGE